MVMVRCGPGRNCERSRTRRPSSFIGCPEGRNRASQIAMKSADWDRLADDFASETCDITREESAKQMARYVGLPKVPRQGAVLADLGCGVGTFIARFGKRFGAIHGVEFAPKIIAHAKARCCGGVNWLTMDIPRAAKRIGSVADLTVCLNVITQPRETDREKLWTAAAAVT